MSSIRRTPPANLPGSQNFSNGAGGQQFPGQGQGGGNPNQRWYGPILAQATNDAMHAVQRGIAQACHVPEGAPAMSPWEVQALTQVVKGLETLAKAKKRCGGNRGFQNQQWNGAANQQASQAEDANQFQENAQFQENQTRQPAYAGAGR